MAAKTQYLTYYIVLTDPDAVAAYQALYPGGVNRAPETGAAIEFGAPWTSWRLGLPGDPPAAPYTWSPWTGVGGGGSNTPFPTNVATFTRHSGGIFGIGGTTIKYYWMGQFQLASSTAAPPGGTGTADANAPDLEYAPMALRRWATGFNVPQAGPGGRTAVGGGLNFSHDAARTTGQRGLALRGANNDSVTVSTNQYRAGTPAAMWQRLYVRLRKLPTGGSVSFWKTTGSPTASNGIALDINSAGQLTVYLQSLSPRTVLGTIDPPLPVWSGLATDDAWRRLDLLVEYANGNPNGYFRVFIDGALQASYTVAALVGTAIQSTLIGESTNSGSNVMELDVADWIGMELPAGQDSNGSNGALRPYIYDATATYQIGDLVHTADGHVYKCIAISLNHEPSPQHNGTYWHRYEGRDWLNGSRVLLSKPKAFGANHSVNWTGNYRTLQQNGLFYQNTTAAALTSSTASAVAEAEMDTGENIDTEPNSVGMASLMIHANSFRGANSGTLGYNINGAGAVDTAITETATPGSYNSVLYPGPGAAGVVGVSPLQARYVKGSSADAANLRSLLAEVELLGVFDRHDYRPEPDGGAWQAATVYVAGDVVERKNVWYTANAAPNAPGAGVDPSLPASATKWTAIDIPDFPRYAGQHNAPYRRSPWALAGGAPPISPFIVHGGTYTGNATGQDVAVFRAPPGLVIIRPLTGGGGGYLWWPTMTAGHRAMEQGTLPSLSDQAEDLTFVPVAGEDTQEHRYLLRVTGSNAQLNANTVVYQYIVVEDPGARFMLNIAVAHNSNLASDVDNVLLDPTFTPEWLFAFVESLDATTSNRFYAKGPGNAAATISNFNAAAVASAMTFGAGKVTTKSAFHALGGTGVFAMNLWRRADGNNDPNQASVVNIGTYTGDGAASRTINLAPASGKRPLFAIVFSESSTGAQRDPSHTTNNSTNSSGADITTGITGGGIDSISVGSTLNSNGVIYNYFILFAGTTAGNAGWGTNGEYVPVEADSPTGGPWPDEPTEPVDPSTIPEPTPTPPPEEPDLDEDTPLPNTDLFCVDFTQRITNRALSRIGITKLVSNLGTSTDVKAVQSRLHFKEDADTVLRDFDWPFATRYATLVLVDGSDDDPANDDWTYAYRAPVDMVKARRIVGQAGQRRDYDPNPELFRVGSDSGGALIYANASLDDADVVLEYTARVSCPAYQGDSLFRNALAWRHAASLAMALAKDPKRQEFCLAMYEKALKDAEVPAANEEQKAKDGDAPWIVDRG